MMIEVPVASVRESPQFPDRDEHNIYEHLKYTLSRPCQFPLPAIGVSLVDGDLLVTNGHKYLRIAQELRRPRIRALISRDLSGQLPAGSQVVPREELENEMRIPVVRDYHVYFFEKPLSPQAQQEFVHTFVEFFEKLPTPLLQPGEKRVFSWGFPFDARCGELEANIPVGDRSWLPKYLRISQEFSRNVARIVSFQGGRFPQ